MGSREGTPAQVEGSAEPSSSVNFDCSLPVMHSYLGSNLEELQGRTVLDDWSYYTLPLLPIRDLVLVPGQTLPLNEASTPTIKMLERCIQTDHLFGSAVLISNTSNNIARIADVGTIAEIYECRSHDNGDTFSVKAIGRQRFRVIEAKREPEGYIKAKVQVLPEIILSDPMAEIRLCTLDRFRYRPDDIKNIEKSKIYFKLDAMTSQWPSWVYSQFRLSTLISRVKEILKSFDLGPNTIIPSDPVALSFWLVRAIPLNDEERVNLLRLNSAIMRLQYILKIHKKSASLICANCQQSVIASQSDIFSMSVEGALGAYVNQHGFIHEIITVHEAKNLQLRGGAATDQFSWFPGYAWRIAQCEQCTEHVGWKFTATARNPNLKPYSFWALTHSSIIFRSVKVEEDENKEEL